MKFILPQPWLVCALFFALSLCGHTSFTDEEIEGCEKKYLQMTTQMGKLAIESNNPGVQFVRMLSLHIEVGARPLRLKLEERQKEFAQERQTSSLLKTQNEDLTAQLRELMLREETLKAELEEQKVQTQIFRALHESQKGRLVQPDSDEETQVPLESSRASSLFGDDVSVVSDWESPFIATKKPDLLPKLTTFMQETPHKETDSI